MTTATTTAPPRMLSLPQVAAATGASLDTLRRYAQELAAAGAIERVGSVWACESARAHLVPAALERVRAAARKSAK